MVQNKGKYIITLKIVRVRFPASPINNTTPPPHHQKINNLNGSTTSYDNQNTQHGNQA